MESVRSHPEDQPPYVALVAHAPFTIYELIDPSLGSPMLGDAHSVNGELESVGLLYGNPLLAGGTLQVITAPTLLTRSLDYLLDLETRPRHRDNLEPGREPPRPANGNCVVSISGHTQTAPVKVDGRWWAVAVEVQALTVTIIASVTPHTRLKLGALRNVEALVGERRAALGDRVAEWQRGNV